MDDNAKGEEAAFFPAMDKLTPLVARAYFLLNHRELDTMIDGLEAMRKNA